MLDINRLKRYRPRFKEKAQKSDDRLPAQLISSWNSMHFHSVSSTNQLNTSLEMNGIHYLAFTLKVSQLTFKVIVRKRTQRWWENISTFKSYLTGCLKFLIWSWQGAAGSGAASVRDSSLTVAPISHFLSLLCKYAPIPTHITQRQPGRAAVWAPHSQQRSMLAGSQQRASIDVLHNSIIVPGDIYLLL